MKRSILAVVLFSLPAVANAQQSVCGDVYRNAVRDVQIEANSSSIWNSIFDDNCKSSGQLKTRDSYAGLDVVVKSLPLSFSGGATETKTRLESFCRSYQSERYSNNESSSFSNSVVTTALESLNKCIALESKNIFVNHAALQTRSSFNVNFTA